jgi:hypothetical protein
MFKTILLKTVALARFAAYMLAAMAVPMMAEDLAKWYMAENE